MILELVLNTLHLQRGRLQGTGHGALLLNNFESQREIGPPAFKEQVSFCNPSLDPTQAFIEPSVNLFEDLLDPSSHVVNAAGQVRFASVTRASALRLPVRQLLIGVVLPRLGIVSMGADSVWTSQWHRDGLRAGKAFVEVVEGAIAPLSD